MLAFDVVVDPLALCGCVRGFGGGVGWSQTLTLGVWFVQRIMRIGLPLAALAYAGTDAARCDAAAEPYMPRVVLPPALPEHRLLMLRAVDALADELLTMLRAVYLVRAVYGSGRRLPCHVY